MQYVFDDVVAVGDIDGVDSTGGMIEAYDFIIGFGGCCWDSREGEIVDRGWWD